MGFRIPWAVFRFPKPKIWIQQAYISRILDPDSRWLVPSRLPCEARVGPSGPIFLPRKGLDESPADKLDIFYVLCKA